MPKVIRLFYQSLGGKGGIVLDTTEGTAAATSPLFAMSGDGSEDISIPMVFLFHQEAQILLKVRLSLWYRGIKLAK